MNINSDEKITEETLLAFIRLDDVVKVTQKFFRVSTLEKTRKPDDGKYRAMFTHLCTQFLAERISRSDMMLCLGKSYAMYYTYMDKHDRFMKKEYYHACYVKIVRILKSLNEKRKANFENTFDDENYLPK